MRLMTPGCLCLKGLSECPVTGGDKFVQTSQCKRTVVKINLMTKKKSESKTILLRDFFLFSVSFVCVCVCVAVWQCACLLIIWSIVDITLEFRLPPGAYLVARHKATYSISLYKLQCSVKQSLQRKVET